MRIFAVLLAFCLNAALPGSASAQQIVGRCVDQMRGQSFAMLANGYMFQEGFPANAGMAVRDPSGQTFLRLPSATPWITAYFVDWAGALVEINPRGLIRIGGCQFFVPIVPPNPYQNLYRPPAMQPNWGVQTPQGPMPIPAEIAQIRNPFAPPHLTTPEAATECFNSTSGNRQAFGECMVGRLAGDRERAAFECSKRQSREEQAFCLVGVLGGDNERRYAEQLSACYQQYGNNWNQYALCLANQNVGPEAGRLLACVQQQSQSGSVTVMGTAMCYGVGSLNLNPEMQIAVQCAATTGGNPYAFAGCTGGQLTARELNKCFTDGVGGDNGCFGRNNEIVRLLRNAGVNLDSLLGPNNDLTRTWNNAVNDLRNGPGPNNDIVRTFSNVANTVNRARDDFNRSDFGRAVRTVLPGFSL